MTSPVEVFAAQGVPVEVAPSLMAPASFQVNATLPGAKVTLNMDVTDGSGVRCSSVFIRAEQGVSVTAEVLRDIPVQRWAREGFGMVCRNVSFMPLSAEEVAAWPNGDVGPLLRFVADEYRRGEVLSDAPTKAVQDALGVSRATASRMVAQAREKGLLS